MGSLENKYLVLFKEPKYELTWYQSDIKAFDNLDDALREYNELLRDYDIVKSRVIIVKVVKDSKSDY